MSVIYKVITRPTDPRVPNSPKRFYPHLITLGQSVSLKYLAEKMRDRSSLSVGDIKSVIQNFVENAIKHSLMIGNSIDIFVIAKKMGDEKIQIFVADTGKGISDEILEKIKRFRETKQYQDGLGVGIQNAIERLEVLYEGKAELKIGRDRPNGTRVELILERKEKGDA